MLKIRLQRYGKKHEPFYRIVVAEHTAPIKGHFIEAVGSYNPIAKPKEVILQEDRIAYWIAVGAKLSPTVEALVRKNSKLFK
ncbi:MAG: 30S ribosomal protein S16 [Patescibacteria group bacterium]|nr:30S ribosomal protein S16 [Patescibacteria group bacterium]